MDAINTEALSRMFLGLLVFRLGGEATFTAEEIDEIRESVEGVQFIATHDGKIIVRCRNHEACDRAIDKGYAI